MALEHDSNLGSISISKEAIAALAGAAVSESYGVVGMASQRYFNDGLNVVLGRGNYGKGVVIRQDENGLTVDLYIIVSYGVKITAVVKQLQERVKYLLEKSLDQKVAAVNVFVQGVRVME